MDFLHGPILYFFSIKMTYYYDLCDSKTFESIRDALTLYGVSEDVLNFTFSIHGRNEETLEDICYYYGLDIDEILKEAWIDPEEEESEED